MKTYFFWFIGVVSEQKYTDFRAPHPISFLSLKVVAFDFTSLKYIKYTSHNINAYIQNTACLRDLGLIYDVRIDF